MVVIRGALGKENALFDYLFEPKLQDVASNTIKSHKGTTKTIEISSRIDSSNNSSNVELPLFLPDLNGQEFKRFIAGYKKQTIQRLALEWQYTKAEGTIFASLKVFSTVKNHLLLEHECVIMANQFKEDNATKFIGDNQSFVALVYAINMSLIDISNAVIQPSENSRSLRLFINLMSTNANDNVRSRLLLNTLLKKFNIRQQDIEINNEPTASTSSRLNIKSPTPMPRIPIATTNTTNVSPVPVNPENSDKETVVSKRKREEESTITEDLEMNHIIPNFELPILLNRDTTQLYKKALTLYPGAKTTEHTKCPVPEVSSLEAFYSYLQPDVNNQRLENYTTSRIAAKLTPFQTQNVEWMIAREGHFANEKGDVETDLSIYTSLPLLYTGSHETDQNGTYVDIITTEASTDRAHISKLIQLSYSGGILSDEMGLGKTVSVLNLVAKHVYNSHDPSHPKIEDLGNLTFSKGTLIVAPGSIISQWRSEIRKHAPQLTTFIYEGRRFQKQTKAEDLARYDIVLVNYEAFRQEIHYAEPPRKRPQRNGVVYDRNREFSVSPLVSTFWFRCILDEAQMIEAHLSTVAAVAKKIPRWYAWAVTGTPMKSDFNDLYGLYDFISIAPSISNPATFAMLCNDPRYMSVFYDFAHSTIRRNTKRSLESQVHIPKQSRHVVRFPFTTIEQHYYDDLWRECKSNTGLDALDNNNWNMDPETRDALRARMRNWLVALRQGCIHPSLIANTSLRLRSSKTNTNSIQTMTEVLQDMAKTAKVNLDHNQYGYYQLKLNKGGMYEVLKDLEKAIEIYAENLSTVEELAEARYRDSRRYYIKVKESEKAGISVKDILDTSESTIHVKWQTLLHRYYFYMASVYHSLGIEDKENAFYSKAGDIRRELLESYTEKVKAHTAEMHRAAKHIKSSLDYHYGIRNFDLDLLPDVYATSEDGSIEYGDRSQQEEDLNVLGNIKGVGHILDQQLAKIIYLRGKIMPILNKSLVDSDKDAEATGEEYDNSLEQQEMCQIYLSAYQSLLQDRRFIINGTTVSSGIAAVDNDEESKQEKTQSVKAKEIEKNEKAFRNQLMTPANFRVECLKDLEVQLRDVKRKIKVSRKKNVMILDEEQAHIRSKLPTQTKLIDYLDNDIKKLTQLFNSRIAYYKYLQSISDTLLEWQSDNPTKEIAKINKETEKLAETITHNKSRDMYFKSLVEEQEASQNNEGDKPKDCLICQDPIEKGMITYCGHSSCYNCGIQWFKTSRRCHTCNSSVKPFEWYRVSYRGMEMHDRDQSEEASSSNSSVNGSDVMESSLINVSAKLKKDEEMEKLIKEIKKQHIRSSQGAKIDSIIRHIKYIKAKNNGKCVVFSQWTKVLTMLRTGLQLNGIQCTTVDQGAGSAASKNKVTKFQEDPNMNVILLHARSQSSGLTLVAAHTAFIVEPVINESLEKQAINRIHRIGQTKETSVFWYIVQDTIEERIHAIHDIKRINNKINNTATEDIEKTQLSRQSEGGGEFVNNDDIRRCFTSDLVYALHK